MRAFWRVNWRALLSAEAIFIGFFLLGLLLRWFNPDLWHPARGGEKPMDYAFFNAVLKSAAFPPYDPWHAGGYINYYYFGFVFVGALTHLTTVLPSIAYNLAVATIFALSAIGAWGVVYGLQGPRQDSGFRIQDSEGAARASALSRRSLVLISAALAPVFVLLLGNLAQAFWFVDGYAAQQAGRPEWAFWDATRIVPGTVNEFPFFTFLFADLHAHMIVMPLSLALLGLGVAVVRRPRGGWIGRWPATLALVGLMGLLAGTLRATNTWDYPTFVGLTAVAFAIAAWNALRRTVSPSARVMIVVRRLIVPFAAVLILGNLFFAPFTAHFTTASSGVELLHDGARASRIAQLLGAERTSLWDELRLYGLWLIVATAGGLVLIRHVLRVGVRSQEPGVSRSRYESLLTVLALAGSLFLLALIGLWREWSALILLLPLLVSGVWLCWQLRSHPPRLLLPTVWGTAALGLLVVVELFVVKGDVGRMNTVFKFGLHSWLLFALMSAVALPWLVRRALERLQIAARMPAPALSYGALLIVLAVLLAASAVYPLTATPARLGDRWNPDAPRTLDGAAFLTTITSAQGGPEHSLDEDAAAIDWLQRNIVGTPIMLEAHRPSYQWAGRIATYTGLPTLLGWEWHQIQQREVVNARPAISNRQNTIQTIYSTPDAQAALDLLRDYGVEYVYVGGAERAAYDATGLAKFSAMAQIGALEEVFSQGQTQIYRVAAPGTAGVLTSDIPVEAPTHQTAPALMLATPVNELPAVGDYAWNGWASGSSWLASVLWLLMLYALALLGLPLAATIFGNWRDGGWAWARITGLLVLGYIVWLPTALGLWRYDRWSLIAGVLVLLGLNAALLWWLGGGWHGKTGALGTGLQIIGDRLRAGRRSAIAGEIVFVIGFLALTAVRALNPDLWHTAWGGEKPMEFGFLNAILRSPVMPPYDPFFSDGYINYYYYGLYLVSLPIRATGIDPALAFNLAVPTIFALTLTAAFALGSQLTGRVRYGLVAALGVGVLGNLAGFFAVGWSRGAPAVADALRGGIGGLGERLGDWYIGPSRVIPNTINEFPAFTFLFADLHPHMIALPIGLLAIALAYSVILVQREQRGSGRWRQPGLMLMSLLALTLGTLAVTNSWDFPTFGLLAGLAFLGSAWRTQRNGVAWAALLRAALLAIALGIVGLALFAPFFDKFYAFVRGIGVVAREATSVRDYLVVYGLFLLVLLPVFVAASARIVDRLKEVRSQKSEVRSTSMVPYATNTTLPFFLVGGVLLLLALASIIVPDLALRIWLLAFFGFGAFCLLERRINSATWFAILLGSLGWAVSFGIETIYIKDHLEGGDWYRMNTVFKFGMQIWLLFAIAAAVLLPNMLRGLRRIGGIPAQSAALVGLATATLLAAFFPIFGTPSRIANRMPVETGPTLNGLAFLEQTSFEYDCINFGGCEPGASSVTIDLRGDGPAIDWLNRRVEGTPIVVQSNQWFYRAYGIRIAANTGLPTVISALHANEQRDPAATAIRDNELDAFYRTADTEMALRFLAKYNVDYVYVGGVERAFYNPDGIAKFARMVGIYLDPVYETPETQIYAVRELPDSYRQPLPVSFDPVTAPGFQQPSQNEPVEDASIDIAMLEAQVAGDPTNGPLVFGLAERYRDSGQLDAAAAVLEPAALANPNDIGLHHLWGDILIQAGRYEEAETAYMRAAQAQPTGGNWTKLGTGLLAGGMLDKAEVALLQAVALDANLPEPRFRLGQLYNQLGNSAQARAELERYLELEPAGQFAEDARALLAELP
jgi:YYY domain-containing protein